MKNYNITSHPADIAIKAEAKTLEELFSTFGKAYKDIVIEGTSSKNILENIEFSSRLIEELLVSFLSNINNSLMDENKVFSKINKIKISRSKDVYKLKSDVLFKKFDLKHHHQKIVIKNVTYHKLKVEKNNGTYSATITLDI
jgi:SHS2 domain-containing protein